VGAARTAASFPRGPDGHETRILLENRCLLGHNRLAIIDLEGGAQPPRQRRFFDLRRLQRRDLQHHELRKNLIASGHHFRTQSDCEVLAHLFEDKGR
jgi:asparagine synthase (glutamine-hydrolysing)